jgi:hypothetical protein
MGAAKEDVVRDLRSSDGSGRLRFHDKINEFTLVVDSFSTDSVRMSIVEISMRWSAGLTCRGHGKPFWSK